MGTLALGTLTAVPLFSLFCFQPLHLTMCSVPALTFSHTLSKYLCIGEPDNQVHHMYVQVQVKKL